MDFISLISIKYSRIYIYYRYREIYVFVIEILVFIVCVGIFVFKFVGRIRYISLLRFDFFDSSEEYWVGFYVECWELIFYLLKIIN